jgi:hypothetical protein
MHEVRSTHQRQWAAGPEHEARHDGEGAAEERAEEGLGVHKGGGQGPV